MSNDCFDDFDYGRRRCPTCGAEFDESEIIISVESNTFGNEICPECGEDL